MVNLLWFLPFVVFFVWFYLRVSQGVGRTCPNCGAPLDLLMSPLKKSRRQWEEGGYLCRRCGCEMDVSAVKVPRGSAPYWPYARTVFTLPAIGVVFVVFCGILISLR